MQGEVLNEPRWEFGRRDSGRRRVLVSFSEADEMIAPSNDATGGVNPTLQEVEAARAVVVVSHVVLTRPDQLHRCADGLRDVAGLKHEIAVETATKGAASPTQVDGDIGLRDVQDLRYQSAGSSRELGG